MGQGGHSSEKPGKVVGKMRNCGMWNAESKMRNRKCGMTLIGQSVKPRDRRHSTDYRSDMATDRAVKCRPVMRKMQAYNVSYNAAVLCSAMQTADVNINHCPLTFSQTLC